MIGQLTGLISDKSERTAIIDVGGVGYKVFLVGDSLKLLKVGHEAKLWTYLAVRENALDLYGFLDRHELEFFELLISVSGIGPKSALAILSLAPPAVLEKAISAGDSSYLTKVSGIGRKSAEKIVLELKDKIGSLGDHTSQSLKGESEAVEALQSLGYTLKEARDALRDIPATLTDTGDKVKAALKLLGK